MPRDQYPSWLSTLQYPQDGIGDQDDLFLTPLAGEASKWVSLVEPGWYYLDGEEEYYYIVEGSFTTTAATGVSSYEHSEPLNPGWGPVLVEGADKYLELNDVLQPASTVAWTQATASGNLYYYTVPFSKTFLGVRDLTAYPMGRVAAQAYLTDSRLYWYDEETRRVYVMADGSPESLYFVDLAGSRPSVNITELAWIDNGTISLTYLPAQNIVLSRGSSTVSVSGTATGDIPTTIGSHGDWVRVNYNSPKTYALTGDYKVDFYTDEEEEVTVRFERSSPVGAPPVRVQNDDTYVFDMNPLNPQTYRTGYLALSNTQSEIQDLITATTVRVSANKSSYTPAWGEEVIFQVEVFDKNGVPIPLKDITLIHNGTEKNTVDTSAVDKAGKLLLRLAGTTTLTVSAIADSATGSCTVASGAATDRISRAKVESGRCNYVIVSDIDPQNNLVSKVSSTQLDGVPKTQTLTVRSTKSTIFNYGNDQYKKSVEVTSQVTNTNLSAISSDIGVKPEKGDNLYCTGADSQSKLLEISDG